MAPKLGILGGGQLAQMLASAAAKLNVETWVYAQTALDPAVLKTTNKIVGPLNRLDSLVEFFSIIDVCIFENEFVDCGLLRQASSGRKIKFFPSIECIEKLQDKVQQKLIFDECGISTARWKFWDSDNQNSQDWILDLSQEFERGFVLKWSRLGYDGKGVFISDPGLGEISEMVRFCERAKLLGVDVYAEDRMPFQRELAIVACRSESGEIVHYPLVISEQTRGVCKRVKGPAVALGVEPSLELTARSYASRVAEAADLVGCFALEFFEVDGKLSVNEVAPRVHNSGHYTQDASECSQFENHVKAAIGAPLGPTKSKAAFVMLNLLGPEGISCLDNPPEISPKHSGEVRLHWYSKHEIKPQRKLGHLNAWASSSQRVPELVAQLDQMDLEWQKKLKTK